MTRGQHSTFGRLTYPTSSFLRLRALPSPLPSTYIFPRESESFALITPRAQGDEVTALFVCHPPATCFALSLNLRVRGGKRQRVTERNGAKTYDAMPTIAYGRSPAHIGHIDSIYCMSIILFVTSKKKTLQSFSRRVQKYFNFWNAMKKMDLWILFTFFLGEKIAKFYVEFRENYSRVATSMFLRYNIWLREKSADFLIKKYRRRNRENMRESCIKKGHIFRDF